MSKAASKDIKTASKASKALSACLSLCPRRHSIYSLYQHKGTNTDAAAPEHKGTNTDAGANTDAAPEHKGANTDANTDAAPEHKY